MIHGMSFVFAGARWLVAGLLGLGCGGATGAGAEIPPFEAEFQSVIDDGEIEGHRVSIVRFRSRRSVDELFAAMDRNRGSGAANHRVESASGPWRIVSHHDADRYRTLQARSIDGGGSEGLYSVWRGAVRSSSQAFDLLAALPSSGSVIRRFASVDAGRRTETLLAWIGESEDRAVRQLHERLLAHGFVAIQAPAAAAPRSNSARLYRKPGQELLFTVSSVRGRSGLVIHHSEASQ